MENVGDVLQAVSAADLKLAKHLPPDIADDAIIDAYLMAAQDVVETACARIMGQRQVAFSVIAGGGLRWWFPVAPVVSLDGIDVGDGLGGWTPVVADFRLQQAASEPQLILPNLNIAVGSELRIKATVGYEAGKWPLQMTQAIKLIASEWFEAGITPEGVEMSKMSFAAIQLIRQKRYIRPFEFGPM